MPRMRWEESSQGVGLWRVTQGSGGQGEEEEEENGARKNGSKWLMSQQGK